MPIEYDDSINIDQIEKEQTDAAQVTEATSFRTVPTAVYVLKSRRVQFRADDRPESRTPGRRSARVIADVMDFDTRQPLGVTVFFSASPDRIVNPDRSGRMRQDSASTLWGQAAKVFGLGIQEVLDGFDKYPMAAKIRESFKMPDGSYQTIRADAKSKLYEQEREDLLKRGGQPTNFVDNLKPLE